MPACTIRIAEPKDIDSLAELHVAIWRDTYRELAPPEAFNALDVPRRKSFWQDKFAHPAAGQGIFIAEVDGKLAGFSLASASSNPEFGEMAEIKFLYVSPAFKRQGIGKLLIAAAPATVAGGRRLFDDFFDNLRLLMVTEQAADALRQHHPSRHARSRFEGATTKAAT